MEIPAAKLSDEVVRGMAEETLGQLRACSLISHPGERGSGRENALRAFFKRLVPPGFDVGSGFVIDQAGRQCYLPSRLPPRPFGAECQPVHGRSRRGSGRGKIEARFTPASQRFSKQRLR